MRHLLQWQRMGMLFIMLTAASAPAWAAYPDATIYVDKTTVTRGASCRAWVVDKGYRSISWSIKGGTIISATNKASITYVSTVAVPGTTTLTCKVTTWNGYSNTKSKSIRVVVKPNAVIMADSSIVATGKPHSNFLAVDQTRANGITSFAWSISGGQFLTASTNQSIMWEALAPMQVTLTCTVTNGAGDSDTKSWSVDVPSAGTLATFAGTPSGLGNVDGTGSQARFNWPQNVVADATGNIYVADSNSHTIRKITANGVVTTLAGKAGTAGSVDGTGSSARFNTPHNAGLDSAGNLYISDSNNHTIRKVTPAGVVTTLAGKAGQSGSTNGTGSAARFNYPSRGCVDASGNIFIADFGNYTVRKITQTGVVTTVAGKAGEAGSDDGSGSSARFNQPMAVAMDQAGNLYVADIWNCTIRKISPAYMVTTIAGSAGEIGSNDGNGPDARFFDPSSVAVDSSGNLYVTDTHNFTIRKINTTGMVSTLAGMVGVYGSQDGSGLGARFHNPYAVSVDGIGNLYVADGWNNTIRKISPQAEVTTFAGKAGAMGYYDGFGTSALFYAPFGVTVDQSTGQVFVADSWNHTIRVIQGAVSVGTLAGNGYAGSSDGTGFAARFCMPNSLASDSNGSVYVADTGNCTIRKIKSNLTEWGTTTTYAGTAGVAGSSDGIGTDSQFGYPEGVAVDALGNVYVADTYNHTIRKISPARAVTTLAGVAGESGSTDGNGSAARFNYPGRIAVDSSGTLFVADTLNHTIRKITPSGAVTTLAGKAGAAGSADGVGSSARFNLPIALAIDDQDRLFVTEQGNNTVRMISQGNVVTTLVGVAGQMGNFPGPLPALLAQPSGIVYDTMSSSLLVTVNDGVLKVEIIF
jgi:sugar lactone lactonase YvrE